MAPKSNKTGDVVPFKRPKPPHPGRDGAGFTYCLACVEDGVDRADAEIKHVGGDDWVFPCSHYTKPTSEDARAVGGERRFTNLLTALKDVGKARRWRFEGAIEGAPLVDFIGPEKGNKSWTLIQMALACVTGQPWLGVFACKTPGPVIYVDGCELGAHEFARRAARISRGMGIDIHDAIARGLHHYYAADLQLASANEAMKWLSDEARRIKPALIVIDPWRNLIAGEENSTPDTIASMQVLAKIRTETDAPITIAHHLNRDGKYSGSRSFKTRADLIFEGSDDEQPWFETKGRYVRLGTDAISKQRFTITVEHDDDEDDTIATTRVALRFENASTTKQNLSKTQSKILRAIRESGRRLTQGDVKRITGISNGKEVSKALHAMKAMRLVDFDDEEKKWSMPTADFFATLGGRSADENGES